MSNSSDAEQKDDKSKDDSTKDDDDDDDIELDADDEEDDDDDSDDGEKDGKSDKSSRKETPEQKVARLKRQLSRAEKKAGRKEDGDRSEPSKDDKKSGEMDYGQKAFLTANGIKSKKEMKLVKEYIANTGKSLEDILESKHFQNDLKDLRDGQATKDATPKGTKRSANSSSDSVEYWIAKGELPPNTPENRELRQKVVNARIDAKKDKNNFASISVIGG